MLQATGGQCTCDHFWLYLMRGKIATACFSWTVMLHPEHGTRGSVEDLLGRPPRPQTSGAEATWRLQCSLFLVMTRFLNRSCTGLLKKELHRSLRLPHARNLDSRLKASTTDRSFTIQRWQDQMCYFIFTISVWFSSSTS